MTLTAMRWFDIAEVAVLDSRAFGHDAWTVEFYWSQAATPGNRFVVDRETGSDGEEHIVGFAGIFTSGPQADVLTIASDPERRGRGIGGRLLNTIIDMARDAGCEAVHLEVRDDNLAAIAMYEARGFERIGMRAGYYHGADAVLMRALLH